MATRILWDQQYIHVWCKKFVYESWSRKCYWWRTTWQPSCFDDALEFLYFENRQNDAVCNLFLERSLHIMSYFVIVRLGYHFYCIGLSLHFIPALHSILTMLLFLLFCIFNWLHNYLITYVPYSTYVKCDVTNKRTFSAANWAKYNSKLAFYRVPHFTQTRCNYAKNISLFVR